jgi:rhodanese-related sulfurtransferase
MNLVTRQKSRIPLAGPANKQGRVAGANAAGAKLTFRGALGTAIVEVLGITAAKTGLSEKEAKAAGIPYYVSYTHSTDHAGYYPGSELLHIKLIAEEGTGRLLGAQIVGEQGVDKRIDILATALSAGMKVTDLENLDLAYAPQFSSAKDPVIMAGFVAANVARHDLDTITCAALQERLKSGDDLQIVDVRSPAEHAAGALAGARLIPVDRLREDLPLLDPEKETVVYCRVGLRGYLASRILRQEGFKKVLNLTGGILSCPPLPEGAVKGTASSVSFGQFPPGAVVIDVREPDEFAYEHIAGSKNIPLGRIAVSLADIPKEKDVYLLCQGGVRSMQALQVLKTEGYARLHNMEGGLNAWKAKGLPTEQRKGPIPIMRQMQIVAGSLALIGGVIPGARWVAAFVGAGLIFAGTSGICMMANLLAKMPWNKVNASPAQGSGCGTGKSCG